MRRKNILPSYQPKKSESYRRDAHDKNPKQIFVPQMSAYSFPVSTIALLAFQQSYYLPKKGPCGFALTVRNQGQIAQQETSQLKRNCQVWLNSLSPRSPHDCACLNGPNNEADAQLNNECFQGFA